MSKRLKSLISFLLAFFIFLEFNPVTKVNAESNVIQDINIYSLDARYTNISIPDNYLTKYQIDLESLGFSSTDTAEYTILTSFYASDVLGYSVESGYAYSTKSITVSETGEVTPGILTLYEAPNGYYYSYPIENYVSVESSLYPGNAIVKVSVGTENRYLYFHHIDYAETYIQEQEEAFLGNANPQNAKQVAELGAQFAAQYPYEGRVSYAELMILEGHGNCWASADMIVKVAKRFGYNAWIRNGRKDTNAGSMHENAIVEDSELGIWYEVEAGYDQQEVPRYYEVRERTSLYSYRTISDNKIEVYSYDAEFKKDTETQISIPDTIDNKTVTSIGVNFMEDERYDCLLIERVAIPKTITNIGENAFALNDKLTDVYYEGTEAEWELIEIANGNDYLTGATIHYNCNGYTEPTLTDTPTPDPTITDTPTPDPTITDTPTPDPTITDAPEPTLTDTPVPTLTETHAQVRANSLLLKDKIGVKFATYLPDAFLNDEGAWAEINGNVCEIGPKDDRGRYPIVYYVAAAQMRDDLVLKLYKSDGTEFPLLNKKGEDVTGTGCAYSVQDYIDEAQTPGAGLNSDEDLMMLLYRMEDYGSFAQDYFKYNESNLYFSEHYKDIRSVYVSTLEKYKPVINQVENSGIRRTGSTLSLKSATELNHKFVLDEGKSIEDYKFYVDGNLITTESTGNVVLRYEQSSGKYVLSIKGIVAAKLHESHTVVVKDINDNEVITIENYSALSYAYTVLYNNAYGRAEDSLATLMKSLYLYNRAAVKYFNVG